VIMTGLLVAIRFPLWYYIYIEVRQYHKGARP
jgi:hypothetical protein